MCSKLPKIKMIDYVCIIFELKQNHLDKNKIANKNVYSLMSQKIVFRDLEPRIQSEDHNSNI